MKITRQHYDGNVQMPDNTCTQKLSLAPLSHFCEFMCMMLFSEVDLFEAPGLTQRLSCYLFPPVPRSGAGFIEGSHESGWLCHGDLWVMNPGCCARNSPVVWGLLFLQDGNERAAVRAAWGDVGGVSLDSTPLDFLLVFYLHVVNVSTLLKLHGCSYAYPGNVFIALLWWSMWIFFFLEVACVFCDTYYCILIESFLPVSAFFCNGQI